MLQSQPISLQPSQAGKIITASIAVLICTTPLIGVLSPRALGFLPAGIGLLGLTALRTASGTVISLNKLYLVTILTTVALAALSSFWSLDADFALERSGKIAFILAGGLALFTVLRSPNLPWPRWFSWALPLAATIAAFLVCGELLTHGAFHHLTRGSAPPENSENLSMLNRTVVFISLVSVPSLVWLAKSALTKMKKRVVFTLLCVALAAALFLTDSQSAQLAMLAASVFWFAFPYKAPKAWGALGVIIIIGILSGPWLVQWLYNAFAAQVKDMPWLASAYAADRLEIWDFVARKALENPFHGFGIEATRHIEHFDTPMLYTPHDHVLHPHNAVLQIWIEFGAIGALGLCTLIAALLRSLYKESQAVQDKTTARLPLCLLMMVLIVSCTAYGFWQGWWLGLLTLLAALGGYVTKPQPQ
ncbi:MAG: O-antigen ligase family protein [Rhodospirillales bacterium]|nr:O-antigen ligase family protein [Rhodospirillales bacterium]